MLPKLFIGSSGKRLSIARGLKGLLADAANVTIWDEAPEFAIGDSILDGLIKVARLYDFALLIFGQDDVTLMNEVATPTVRDNVVFELGLFMGHMGKGRAFWLEPVGTMAPRLATDLGGIIHLDYDEPDLASSEPPAESLAATQARIRQHIDLLGFRTDRTGHVVVMKRALCLASMQYSQERFKQDIEYIHSFFSEHAVTSEQGVTADHFQSHFGPHNLWDLIHLGLFVDKDNQRMLFDPATHGQAPESLRAEAIEGMIKDSGAALVVIITCDSLKFGEQLARFTNVIAGHQAIAPRAALSWAKVFYQALAAGMPLFRAFDKAQDMTDPGLVLLARRDIRFTRQSEDSA